MRFFYLLVLLWTAPICALAEVSAILIGVSDYDNSTGIADLKGPKNDVVLLRDVLSRRGVTDITILADGVDGATVPTRDAILATLADKSETVGVGDFVYIHYSGHGTQQKDLNGDETDGLDEVLLPADTAQAERGTGLIPNAIVDDEIGAALDRIRATGANVWLVLDSCHSGSGLRAAGVDFADRFVDPAVLGVDVTPGVTRGEAVSEADLPQRAGGMMAFYAAQSSELAREVRLTDDAFYGLFTSKLAARLDGGGGQSFRQLFQATLRDMNDSSVPGAARMQTPLWSGDLIDAAVFGDASTAGLRRFEVRGDEILAGLVHGLADGTLVGLVENANDPADAIISYAQMELTDATGAFLHPVGGGCQPMSSSLCEKEGIIPKAAKFAQVVARPIDLVVSFASPVDVASGAPLADDHPAAAALNAAIDTSPEAVVISRDTFDVDVAWDGEALWFGPRAKLQSKLIGRRWGLNDGGLDTVITQIAKAETLDRLLTSLSGDGSILNPSPVEVTGRLTLVAKDDLLPDGTNVSPARECRAAMGRRDPAAETTLIDAVELKQCDAVDFIAQGTVPGARDVNRIHIDAKYCIHNEYARVVDTAAPTQLGGGMILCSNCPGGYSAGDERLIVVVSEAAANSPALVLTGLIENCVEEGATRSARSGAVKTFLGSLSQGRATRGNLGAIGLSNIWVDRYRWTVLPKEIALQDTD